MQRRTLLAATSALLTTSLAGCSDDSDSNPDSQATPADNGNDNNSNGSNNEAQNTSTDATNTPTEESTPTGTPEQQAAEAEQQAAEAEREAIGYPSEYIEISDVSWNPPENEYSGPTVTGIAENVSGEELNYVEVHIQAFNADDTQIGEGLDNVTDLRAEKSWQFECLLFGVEESEAEYWMGSAEVSTN